MESFLQVIKKEKYIAIILDSKQHGDADLYKELENEGWVFMSFTLFSGNLFK